MHIVTNNRTVYCVDNIGSMIQGLIPVARCYTLLLGSDQLTIKLPVFIAENL